MPINACLNRSLRTWLYNSHTRRVVPTGSVQQKLCQLTLIWVKFKSRCMGFGRSASLLVSCSSPVKLAGVIAKVGKLLDFSEQLQHFMTTKIHSFFSQVVIYTVQGWQVGSVLTCPLLQKGSEHKDPFCIPLELNMLVHTKTASRTGARWMVQWADSKSSRRVTTAGTARIKVADKSLFPWNCSCCFSSDIALATVRDRIQGWIYFWPSTIVLVSSWHPSIADRNGQVHANSSRINESP